MEQADAILITGLEFYGFHGMSNEERAIGHRYRVDLKLFVDTRRAAMSDSIQDTIDYAEVAAIVLAVGIQERFHLLEALAQRVVDALFLRFPRLDQVELRILKRVPPMDAIVKSVGIEIVRRRGDSP